MNGQVIALRIDPDKRHVIHEIASHAQLEFSGVQAWSASPPDEGRRRGIRNICLRCDSKPGWTSGVKRSPNEQRSNAKSRTRATHPPFPAKSAQEEENDAERDQTAEDAHGKTNRPIGWEKLPPEVDSFP